MPGTFWSLFRKSPFKPVQEHMRVTAQAAELVHSITEALIAGDQAQVKALARLISQMEGQADAIKKDLRDHLPKSLFLPVDRGDILRQISAQDAVADCAEDVGVLLTLRVMDVPPFMVEPLRTFVARVMDCVRLAAETVAELDVLVQAAFAGAEAQRVLELVDKLHLAEHQADKAQDQIAKIVFAHEDEMKPVAVFMWSKILNKIGDVANHAENVGDYIRLFLSRA